MTEKLVKEFVDSFFDTVEKAEVASMVTGNDDFKLLALAMVTLINAQHKGDLEDFVAAMADVIETKLGKKDPAQKAVDDLLKNIGLN